MAIHPNVRHLFEEYDLEYLVRWTKNRMFLMDYEWVDRKTFPRMLWEDMPNGPLAYATDNTIVLGSSAGIDLVVHEIVHTLQPAHILQGTHQYYALWKVTQSEQDFNMYWSSKAEIQAREIQRQWVHWSKVIESIKYRQRNMT